MSEEIWSIMGESTELSYIPWPTYNADLIKSDKLKIPVQVNGKRRSEILVSSDLSKEEILHTANNDLKVIPFLEGKDIVNEIYVKGRIVNIVTK